MGSFYRSAVDGWLIVLLGLGALVATVSGSLVVVSGQGPERWIAGLVTLVGVGLPLWILRSTSYTLTETELIVRSGPVRRRVAIADIVAITPTRNPLSAPALSLDRLRIDVRRGGYILISPADRASFLADLQARRSVAAGTQEPGA